MFIDGRIIEKGIELAAVISAHKSGEQVNEAGLSFSGFTIRSNGLKLVIKIYSPGWVSYHLEPRRLFPIHPQVEQRIQPIFLNAMIPHDMRAFL